MMQYKALCLLLLVTPVAIRCMEDSGDQLNYKTFTSDAAPSEAASSTELAKKAIRITLGSPNDYLERMLARRLEGKEQRETIIPIHRIPESLERAQLREYLAAEAARAQQDSVALLRRTRRGAEAQDYTEQSQPITRWVLHAVLDEKLKDREGKENSDYWKYINGTLALVLPVATFLLQHFLTKCQDGSAQ